MQPGDYPLEVRLDGYETLRDKIVVPAAGLSMTVPDLKPLPTSLRISADLQRARIRLDDRKETSMEDADFQVDDSTSGRSPGDRHRWP